MTHSSASEGKPPFVKIGTKTNTLGSNIHIHQTPRSQMKVWLNGNSIEEEDALVSAFDRGFLYGDGVFEAILIRKGIPFLWKEHWERMAQGSELLQIPIPFSESEVFNAFNELVTANEMPDCLGRIQLTRGPSNRGYSPGKATSPTTLISLHPSPVPTSEPTKWTAILSKNALPNFGNLAVVKSSNKLLHILARMEAEEADANAAVLVGQNGKVVEACSSNAFWIADDTVCTPPLGTGGLAGVTRQHLLDLCSKNNIPHKETDILGQDLHNVQSLFLTMSTFGIVEITHLDSKPLSSHPLTKQLQTLFVESFEQSA